LAVHTRFILIEPSHAGNVGAVARAMKTMGFDGEAGDLVLVRPRWANVLNKQEAIERASGAVDVLRNARIVDCLDVAFEGVQFACATAMTPRDFGPPTWSPRAAFAHLAAGEMGYLLSNTEQENATGRLLPAENTQKTAPEAVLEPVRASMSLAPDSPAPGSPASEGGASISRVAFVFGPERYGMANEDVYRCSICLSIPTNPAYGSLNLAAAAQLIAYDWRCALGGYAQPQRHASEPQAADIAQVLAALDHWEQSLVAVGYLDPQAPKKLMPRLTQLLLRAQALGMVRDEEIHILRGIARQIGRGANKPD
jgi:tRNA/rRNA methyltransferase